MERKQHTGKERENRLPRENLARLWWTAGVRARHVFVYFWNSFTNVVVKGVPNRINKLNIYELLGKKIKWVNKKPCYTVRQK